MVLILLALARERPSPFSRQVFQASSGSQSTSYEGPFKTFQSAMNLTVAIPSYGRDQVLVETIEALLAPRPTNV